MKKKPGRKRGRVGPQDLSPEALSKLQFFTTFQFAKLFGVFPSTVINWVKSGKLKAAATPGGHRRITRAEVERFAVETGYQLPWTENHPSIRIVFPGLPGLYSAMTETNGVPDRVARAARVAARAELLLIRKELRAK